MSEINASQSGIKQSFARCQQLLNAERKSASFLEDLKLSGKNGHLSPLVSSILEPKMRPVPTESCWDPLGTKDRAGAWGLTGPEDCRSFNSCPETDRLPVLF